jgi:thiol-disulfide isomerase/thioredoxin
MLGPLTKGEILKNFPDWEAVAALYLPQPEAIDQLKAIAYEVRIDVYLGTWCPDSKKHVSEFFKVLEMVDNPLLAASYIGVPRNKEARQPYIEGKDIIRIPTFIVFIDGVERGRIIETPEKSVEEDLVAILHK